MATLVNRMQEHSGAAGMDVEVAAPSPAADGGPAAAAEKRKKAGGGAAKMVTRLVGVSSVGLHSEED